MAKAQEEVDRVLQGRSPAYEDIKDLKFLTRCIMESLRLYPHPPVGCNVSQNHNIMTGLLFEMENIFASSFVHDRSTTLVIVYAYENQFAW